MTIYTCPLQYLYAGRTSQKLTRMGIPVVGSFGRAIYQSAGGPKGAFELARDHSPSEFPNGHGDDDMLNGN